MMSIKNFVKNQILTLFTNKHFSDNKRLLHKHFTEILQDYKILEYGAALNPVDAFFAYRLLLGRNPNLNNELSFLLSIKNSTYREFINSLLASEEFSKSIGFLPANKKLMSEIEGFRFWFNSSDREMGVRMALGSYEPASVELIKKLVKPGMTCIDAGANTGFYTCLMATCGAFVYAFEPMPSVYDFLEKNIEENNLNEKVQIHNLACSDSNKNISGSMVSNMYITTEIETTDKVTMKAVALDDIITSPVNVIKIDIEGHEPKALQGMQKIISQHKPTIISEINEYWLQKCSGIGANEYIKILNDFGYKVFDVNELKIPLKATEAKFDILQTMDIVAFPN
ncbi:MAG: hypothetical protein C6Y22_26875 [Hapalosiphonaceae cyanobacterium JJU2]|nr:MAG: hypothetical protein C6Y22_26875 [Hapalosiphonaceae cyanobacterium JJU2]